MSFQLMGTTTQTWLATSYDHLLRWPEECLQSWMEFQLEDMESDHLELVHSQIVRGQRFRKQEVLIGRMGWSWKWLVHEHLAAFLEAILHFDWLHSSRWFPEFHRQREELLQTKRSVNCHSTPQLTLSVNHASVHNPSHKTPSILVNLQGDTHWLLSVLLELNKS